jgi:hypothetical protein
MIVKNKRESKMNRKGKNYCLRRTLARLPSASSAARHLLLLLDIASGICTDWGKEDLRSAKI